MSNIERRIISALYQHIDNMEHCVYCGVPAECHDHLTPVAFIAKLREVMNIETALYTTDSCSFCNGLLSDQVFDTFVARFDYVKRKIEERNTSLAGHWTDKELNQLEGRLRQYVEQSLWADRVNSRVRKQRLQWKITDNLASVFLAHLNLRPRGTLVLQDEISVPNAADRDGIISNAKPRLRLSGTNKVDQEFYSNVVKLFGKNDAERIMQETRGRGGGWPD